MSPVLSRGIIYLVFIGAMALGWLLNRKQKKPAVSEPEIVLENAEAIESALQSPRWQARLAAVKALSAAADPKSVELLCARLHDTDSEVREAASLALIGFGDKSVACVGAVLAEGSLTARELAAKTLRDLRSPDAVSPLARALHGDESAWVRIPAAQGLGRVGSEAATEALIATLTDSHREVVHAVREALMQIDSPAARAALASASKG